MKAFKSNFTGTRRSIARIICALICVIVCVFQVTYGVKMIRENANDPPLSTSIHFDSFTENQIVVGELTKIDGFLQLDPMDGTSILNYYFCISDTGHVMSFRTAPDSEMDFKMSQLYNGNTDKVYYKGIVKKMADKYYAAIRQDIAIKKLSKKMDIDLAVKEALLDISIDVSPYDAAYSQKAITATFVGAVLMFLLAVLFMWKIFKNAVQTIAAEKGYYHPDLKVTKDDIEFEMEGMYNSDESNSESFFINTEFNTKDYGVYKENDRADRHQLPSAKDDPALNRNEKDEPLFYKGEVNEEGNFYVDSTRKAGTDFGQESLTKRY